MRLVELFEQAGAPRGVLQVVHGGKEQVDFLLANPVIKAVSFVGSVPVAKYIYQTGTSYNKRVQAFAGAKNHMVVMPDANQAQVVNSLVGASVGAAGQRCMAISVAVFVGDSKEWIGDLATELAKVRPGVWNDEKAGYGPLISKEALDRVLFALLMKEKLKVRSASLMELNAWLMDTQMETGWAPHFSAV